MGPFGLPRYTKSAWDTFVVSHALFPGKTGADVTLIHAIFALNPPIVYRGTARRLRPFPIRTFPQSGQAAGLRS